MSVNVICDIITLLDEFLTFREFRNLSLTSHILYNSMKFIIQQHEITMNAAADYLNLPTLASENYDKFPWDKIDNIYLMKKIIDTNKKINSRFYIFNLGEFFNRRKTINNPKFPNIRFYERENSDITYRLIQLCSWRMICLYINKLTLMEIKIMYRQFARVYRSIELRYLDYYSDHRTDYYDCNDCCRCLIDFDDEVRKLIGSRKKGKLLRPLIEVRQVIKSARNFLRDC
jgi:hypothetical protein